MLLGKATEYPTTYTPSLLHPIPRGRKAPPPLPFHGVDIWNGYELSWLNPKGKPQVALAVFTIPCESTHLIESKSFKLYLNSFNQSRFPSASHVKSILENDLSHAAGGHIHVDIIEPSRFAEQTLASLPGVCIDDLDIAIDTYDVDPSLLTLAVQPHTTEERLFSHLLKSNCPVTDQPDWATVWIHYIGQQIDHTSLLKYVVSYRNHQEFHEHCVESFFNDIMTRCHPEKLSVYARYTRRGGLDINPFRSNFASCPPNHRLCRQ